MPVSLPMSNCHIDQEHPHWPYVLCLASSFDYDAAHAHQVVCLSLMLFDELQDLHGRDETARFLLQTAALLHDIGRCDGSPNHHKASQRYIVQAPLPFGATHRRIIGCAARYHRGPLPREGHRHYRRLDEPDRALTCLLGGILRLADGLDHSHRSLVTQLTCEVRGARMQVCCATRRPLPWSHARAADQVSLLEQVLGRPILIDCAREGDLTLRQADQVRSWLVRHRRRPPAALADARTVNDVVEEPAGSAA